MERVTPVSGSATDTPSDDHRSPELSEAAAIGHQASSAVQEEDAPPVTAAPYHRKLHSDYGLRMLLSLPFLGIFTRAAEVAAIWATIVLTSTVMAPWLAEQLPAQAGRLTVLLAVLYGVVAQLSGAYDADALFSLRRSWSRALQSWLAAMLFALSLGMLIGVLDALPLFSILACFLIGGCVLALTRALAVLVTRHLKDLGTFDRRCAIVGNGPQAAELAQYILAHDKLTFSLMGLFDPRDQCAPYRDEHSPLPVLGGMDTLIAEIRASRVLQVIVALPWSETEQLNRVLERLSMTPARIRLAPERAGFLFAQRPVELVGDVPMMTLFDRPISDIDQAMKGLEDRILASLMVLFLGPLMAVVALLIKLDSKGPIFFRQPREGLNCRSFLVWKFRTMYAEECVPESFTQVQKGDPRVTRVGSFLRKSSLDEVPQLFNVLFGQMSLVGPRPHAPSTRAGGKLYGEVVQTYAARHKVKPGITGWAQVCGWRGETDTEEKLVRRLEHDLYYIENWSIWFDLYILVRTAATVMFQRSAY